MPFSPPISDTQNSSGSNVTTLGVTIPAVKPGYLVVVNIKFAAGVSGVSVTDNASTPNTYAGVTSNPVSQGAARLYQFYGVAITGGATIITANWTTGSAVRITVDVFSGGKKTNAAVFDKSASNTGGAGTSSSLTLAPTVAGELVVGAIIYSGTPTSPAAGANYLLSNANTSLTSEYRQVATTVETVPFSWTGSLSWAEIAGVYIPDNEPGNFFAVM